MSPDKAGKKTRFEPSIVPEPTRLNLTLDELHGMLERFQKMFENSPLARYIKMAGWFALLTFVVELMRMVWLMARYVFHF